MKKILKISGIVLLGTTMVVAGYVIILQLFPTKLNESRDTIPAAQTQQNNTASAT